MARRRHDDPASRPYDDTNPEWTLEHLRRSRPSLDVTTEVGSSEVAEALRRGPGRPEKPCRKVNQTLRPDPDVLGAYRRLGAGRQTRINEIMRENTPRQTQRIAG